MQKMFGSSKKGCIFAIANEGNTELSKDWSGSSVG